MWKRGEEGSTTALLQLCGGYFFFYVLTGVSAKYFVELGKIEYLVYNTLGGVAICVSVVLWKRWWKLGPKELAYVIPSGICTAIIIPTTTLMYTLPISVMVAMVIMRGAVIVISRLVDEAQIRQGILQKKLYREENIAVIFALGAVGVNLFWDTKGGFDFVHDVAAMLILGSYIVAYSFRIYIMNYYKNTRPKGEKLDNNSFFGVEQISATIAMALGVFFLYASGLDVPQVNEMRAAIDDPKPSWGWATISGLAYGMVAFFSVFIFMFKGRTATFAGLVNRLTSLVAGTVSTLLVALFLGGLLPKIENWISLALILVAVGFLSIAERRRAAEQSTRLQANVENAGNSFAPGAARIR